MKPYAKIDFFPKDYVLDEKIDFFKKNYVSTKYRFNQEIKAGKKSFNEELAKKNKEIGLTDEKTNYIHDSLDRLQLSPVWLYETDKVFPLKTILFEGFEFKCPKEPEYYLRVLFGPDFMELPKVIDYHNLIPFIKSQFNSKEEMDEAFEKSIKYLKDINDNFK